MVPLAGAPVLGPRPLRLHPGQARSSGVGGQQQARRDSPDPATRFKGKTLNLLVWEGYSDPKFVKGFEDKYGVTVKGTYFGTSDELVAKLKSSKGVYDVVSPSTDVATTLIESNLIAPVDTTKIVSYGDIVPVLRDMKDVQKNGKTYGVPFTWGPDYLIYDADVIRRSRRAGVSSSTPSTRARSRSGTTSPTST